MQADATPPVRRFSRVLRHACWCAAVGLLGMSLPYAGAQPSRLFETTSTHNTPGLRCWGVQGGMASKIVVFARPGAGSPALGHTVSMVAATGQPRDGYLPVLTSVGVSGWMREAEVERDRWTGQTCVVRREANGHLTFSYGHALRLEAGVASGVIVV